MSSPIGNTSTSPTSLPPDAEPGGRVMLITGGTTGIGRAAATALASTGATVIVGGRDRGRTRAAAAEIATATGNPNVDYTVGDLTEPADVRAVAAEVLARHPRIDVLVNNAGGAFSAYSENSEGVERTWALNYLAPFLLTDLLLPGLLASVHPVVISIGSSAHRRGRIDWDDLNRRDSFSGLDAYAQAKLALTMFTPQLARRMVDSPLTVATADPGAVSTNFFARPEMASMSGAMRMMSRAMSSFSKPAEAGAETTVRLASAARGTVPTGQLWDGRGRPSRPSARARDIPAQARLWQLGREMTSEAGLT